jgi:hypothetical protein
VLVDFRIFGKPAGLELRVNQLPINAHFEAASAGRNQNEPLDPGLELRNEFLGQTDRLGFVVSNLAVDNFDIHTI